MQRILLLFCAALLLRGAVAQPGTANPSPLQTTLTDDALDNAAFAAWVDGAETNEGLPKEGAAEILWRRGGAREGRPNWPGVAWGNTKTPGARHLRIAFKTPQRVGAVLVRGGGTLSVLKPGAATPGALNDDTQWIAAQRLESGEVWQGEATREDYVLWTLPQILETRALRFAHVAKPADRSFQGWLGGALILSERFVNLAPQAVASTSANNKEANLLNNASNDGTWGQWDNGNEGGAQIVSADNAEWVMLTWPQAVPLRGLIGLWTGFGSADAQVYSGPATRHPREAAGADWKTLRSVQKWESGYPLQIWPNVLDFGESVTTRAVRLKITGVTVESHPHLNNNTRGGKRVWLGELMALRGLANEPLKTAMLPRAGVAEQPPIPIRFRLAQAGFVTLVIEDEKGQRVRNLVSETRFPAGENTVYWDGADDLGRDPEAYKRGLYFIPTSLVAPGKYFVRGLYHGALDLNYEFSVYNAGTPAWLTEDGSGGWLTNHTPPSSALYVPAAEAPGGKALMYLGSYVSEGGSGLAWTNLEGRKQGGRGWVGGNWTAAPFLARDAGPNRGRDVFAYVAAAWGADSPDGKKTTRGEIRLTGLTANGDRPILKWSFEPRPNENSKINGTGEQNWGEELGGFAVRDGLLVFSLKRSDQLGFVDVGFKKLRGLVSVPNPRGVAFDAQGRLLVLSGKKLVRYTLPPALKPVTQLDAREWAITASTQNDNAAKAIDADNNSRWSTNAWQKGGEWLQVDMKTPRAFTTIVLESQSAQDAPRGYDVTVSDDGANWKSVATGDGGRGVTLISFPRVSARYFKITQTKSATDAYWSVNALTVFDAPTAENLALPAGEELSSQLEDPRGIALDAPGNIYVSDGGNSHQVKVFAADSSPLTKGGPRGVLRTIGKPGAPKAGPYDVLHMNNPKGLSVDGNGRLWVAEEDYQPKRVSVWNADGTLWKAFYGPSEYGGGGKLDPRDPSRFYYHGMEFRLDWKTGKDQLAQVFFRPQEGDLKQPDGWGSNGTPEAPIYFENRQYMTNAWNSNPTNGAPVAMLWQMKNGLAVPVAALGNARNWDIVTKLIPAEFGARDDVIFAWSDANDDAQVQASEVQFRKAASGGVTVGGDLSFLLSRVDDNATRFAPTKFVQGTPIYDLSRGETLLPGAQRPTTSGGDQILLSNAGWVVSSVAPKPFSPYGLGGAQRVNGAWQNAWSYPSLWPGLHASHEAPKPDRPGMLIGTTRLLGGWIEPKGAQVGPLWSINGNHGNMYLFTQDGLFVATLFNDMRLGKAWAMPIAERGMKLNEQTLHDENFWPSITQTEDGRVFVVDGARTSLVRVDGLETLRPIAKQPLTVTQANLDAARGYFVREEARRQAEQGTNTLIAELRTEAPTVDGKIEDWANASWVDIDKRGVAAYFDSNSKPYDVTGAVAVAGDRLFAAWRVGDANLLRNSGETPNALFKTGGALDLMIGSNANADPKRPNPIAGDLRLLVTRVKDVTRALIYRAVVPGTATPVPFSSPWRTINIDVVEDVSEQVQLAGDGGNYEISIPLKALNLSPQAGLSIKGDIGILRGNGFQTQQRVYWSNKATAITADVPSEAQLMPALWGKWQFETR